MCVPVFADQITTENTGSDAFKTLVKTEASGAEFVVAIPQEIVMERDDEDFTRYFADYTIKVKGILPKGAFISVEPVSSFNITTPTQSFSSKVYVSQSIVKFFARGTDKKGIPSDGVVMDSLTSYTKTTGTISSTIENAGTYSGYMGFNVELNQ